MAAAAARAMPMSAPDWAASLWALATLSVRTPATAELSGSLPQDRIAELTPQTLATTVWSFAVLHQAATGPSVAGRGHSVLESTALRTVDAARDLDAETLTTTLWAFALLCVQGCSPGGSESRQRLCDSVSTFVSSSQPPGLNSFRAEDLARSAWALGVLRAKQPSLVPSIAAELSQRLKQGEQVDREDLQN